MHKKVYNAAFLINVIFQAFFNLMFPMAAGFFAGYVLTEKLSFPQWWYAVLLVAGLAVGLFSMIKFLLYALDAFEKTEAAQRAGNGSDMTKENDCDE